VRGGRDGEMKSPFDEKACSPFDVVEPENVHGEDTRYFVITSNTKENVVKSVKHSLWATQRKNEQRLDEAFRGARAVVLAFSVNGSEAFQGYARMRSAIGRPRSRRIDPFNGFGRLFDIEWLRLHDLPYREVENLRNPLNGDKPIRYSRDGQELGNSVGRALCRLIDRHIDEPESFPPPRSPSPVRRRSPPRQQMHPPPVQPPWGMPPDPHGAQHNIFANPPPPLGYYDAPGAYGGGTGYSDHSNGGRPVPPPPVADAKRERSCSGGSEDGKRRKRRKKDKKSRQPPHPLATSFEDQVVFFETMDYEEYCEWFERYGAVSPGPTPPPGTVPNGSAAIPPPPGPHMVPPPHAGPPHGHPHGYLHAAPPAGVHYGAPPPHMMPMHPAHMRPMHPQYMMLPPP